MLIPRNATLLAFIALIPQVRAQSACATWPDAGHETGLGGIVRAAVVFDDGSGPAWFVGGSFQDIPGHGGWKVAKWDGAHWVPIPVTGYSSVEALAVWDDGNGPALYIGGDHVGFPPGSGIVRWDGATVSAVGPDVQGVVRALKVYDAGSGPLLYATGDFQQIGGASIPGIARWTGTSWQNIGGLLNVGMAEGLDLIVHDDGSGPSLVVGGRFGSAGGVLCNTIAKFGPTGWSALGNGPIGGAGALAVHDFGSGPELIAGAWNSISFTLHVSRWDGASWSTIGAGIPWYEQNTSVLALESFPTSGGAQLFAGGGFDPLGSGVRMWDGTSWIAPAGGVSGGPVEVFALRDEGSGPRLFVGGGFQTAGGLVSKNWTAWDGAQWIAPDPPDGVSGDTFSVVNAVCAVGDGFGDKLYLGGRFDGLGTTPANGIGSWDGSSWSALPGIEPGAAQVLALCAFDDGAGEKLYAGGNYDSIGALSTLRRIARWNGAAWEDLPENADPGVSSPWNVAALIAFDDGAGSALYVGGNLTSSAFGAQHVLRWRNGDWSPIDPPTALRGGAFGVHDDGTGRALYASVGSSSASVIHIAKWDGVSWQNVGGDFVGQPSTVKVSAYASFDDGSGPALYVGGTFTSVEGNPAANIARWKDGVWTALGSGTSSTVNALAVHDDGRGFGPAVFVGGTFSTAGGLSVQRIARYDGAAWSALDVGVSAPPGTTASVKTLMSLDLGAGRDLFVGGIFAYAGGQYATDFARWAGCGESGKTFCYGDGSATICPCGNASAVGDRAGCLNSLGQAGALRGRGEVSLSDDTFSLDGSGMTNSSALYFQAANVANGGTGVVFGDGIKCTNGPFVRLGTKVNASGASTYPDGGDATVSVKGLISAPGVKRYQVRYRNVASFCTIEPFNYTNGVEVVWRQ